VVEEGDTVKVKFLGMDDRGKIKLSMKVVDQATGEDLSKKRAEGGEGGEPAPAPAEAEAASGGNGDGRPRRRGGRRD